MVELIFENRKLIRLVVCKFHVAAHQFSRVGHVDFVLVLAQAIDAQEENLHASIGHAVNKHRPEAQAAHPAIISLETGLSLEEHLKDVVACGSLEGFGDASTVFWRELQKRRPLRAYRLLRLSPQCGGSHDDCDWYVCVLQRAIQEVECRNLRSLST